MDEPALKTDHFVQDEKRKTFINKQLYTNNCSQMFKSENFLRIAQDRADLRQGHKRSNVMSKDNNGTG